MTSYLPTRALITTLTDPDVLPVISGQKFLVQKSPTFPPTIVRRSVTGREIRASFGDIPFWQFKGAYESVRDRPSYQELQLLFAFFCSHLGQLGPWFYYDTTDNAVNNCRFGTGDGVNKTFQLNRMVGSTTINAFSEPVYCLYNNPTIKVNGTTTGAYTLGPLGSVTFTSAPAASAALTWSGQFLFLCRFAKDQIDPAQLTKDLWELGSLEFTSWIPL